MVEKFEKKFLGTWWVNLDAPTPIEGHLGPLKKLNQIMLNYTLHKYKRDSANSPIGKIYMLK